MEKQFKTFDDLLGDSVFKQNIADIISGMIEERRKRPQPKPGFHYVRDAYDRMKDNNQLNSGFFLKNIVAIRTKRSSLGSEVRTIIDGVCGTAYKQTLEFYEGLIKEAEK